MKQFYKLFSQIPQRLWRVFTGNDPTIADKHTAAYFWLRESMHFMGGFFVYGTLFAALLFTIGGFFSFGIPLVTMAIHLGIQETIHQSGGQPWAKTIADIAAWGIGFFASTLFTLALSGKLPY
jgi:hypothetical protein